MTRECSLLVRNDQVDPVVILYSSCTGLVLFSIEGKSRQGLSVCKGDNRAAYGGWNATILGMCTRKIVTQSLYRELYPCVLHSCYLSDRSLSPSRPFFILKSAGLRSVPASVHESRFKPTRSSARRRWIDRRCRNRFHVLSKRLYVCPLG